MRFVSAHYHQFEGDVGDNTDIMYMVHVVGIITNHPLDILA
jgi:hypothetical protein